MALAQVACSSDGSDGSIDDGSSSDSTGNGSSSAGTGSSPGVTGSGGAGAVTNGGSTSNGNGPGFNLSSAGGDGAGGGADVVTCGTSTQETDITPIDMYIMFDRSSSMNNDSVPTLWEEATTALTEFLVAPGSADFGVALRFFPDDDPAVGCIGPAGGMGGGQIPGAGGTDGTEPAAALSCDVAACTTPLVPVGNLIAETGAADPQETLLVTAIANKAVLTESQGTPTFAALSGGLDWGNARLASTPDRKPIVVLVTDGEPNGCGDINQIATLAEAGSAAGVNTYVIGLDGSSQNTINTIARAGGTEGIFIGGADGNASADLIAALDAIRGEALLCEFPTPVQETGAAVDTDKVNLTITLTDLTVVDILKAESLETCMGGKAWFYTDESKETITLCPIACDLVKNDENARIDVQLGCASKPVK